MKITFRKKEYLVMAAIVVLFILGSVFSFFSIWLLQGFTQMVNDIGIVRSSTQMLVTRELMIKVAAIGPEDSLIQSAITRELMNLANDREIERVEEIIQALVSSTDLDKVILRRDKVFFDNMRLIQDYWEQLKRELARVKEETSLSMETGSQNSQLAQMLFASSQNFYELLNAAGNSAELSITAIITRTQITLVFATLLSMLIIILGLFYLHRLKGVAEAATEEIAVMKDSLGISVFLMDTDFVIQPQYSKSLETILGEENLFNRKFTDILSSSVSAKEQETLTDYFSMIINRSFDIKMLEDINPVSELHYVHNGTREEKTLRCAFARIDRGNGGVFLLGTVEDITGKVLLQKQLTEEADKREEEMRALFEIIQVEPRVFNDFLEDMEYEFSRINDMLKNKELTSQFAMVDIYQSIHAIKSNAIILGLENFSKKMQALESEIKKIRDKKDIDFEDTLHITVEIERVMKEKDRFQEILEKIQSFKISDVRSQDEYVLIQSLIRASGKAARDLGKKVELVIDALDPQAIKDGPRRVIKEILMQLVRNSVYHGIETPEERTALGKDITGKIHLLMGVEGDKIHITLRDDGRGLDFGSIREKARELNLLKDTANSGDNKHLARLIFSPGFSTAEDAGFHAGRGIGLSLVRDRLHDINGSIKLQTEQGKGITFHIFLPLEPRDKAQVS
jgi:two-component system chemotaxis sensor kinase CheA